MAKKGNPYRSSAYYRARILAIKDFIARTKRDDELRFWQNGVLPEGLNPEDFEKQVNSFTGKVDDSPLSFTEVCSFNTWFEMHPLKVAGKEERTTSLIFPVTVKGTREDIIKTIKQNTPDNLLIAEAESEAVLLILEMNNLNGMQENGDHGPVYRQFKGKPKEAIRFLIKKRNGEATEALYRSDIGFIDVVWGENDPRTHKGYGLKHIIEKHGASINELGFTVEDFIPIIVQYGEVNLKQSDQDKRVYEGRHFRFVIRTSWNDKKKTWLLSAFDLRKKPKP